jgi:Uma2 family endonuclease
MATTTKLTLEQFLVLPETEPASELIDGEVVQKTMPTLYHAVIQRLLSFVFTLYLREHPIGEAGPELRCLFGSRAPNQARLPDFMFVSADRLQGVAGDQPLPGAPDLAVEILSPDDRTSKVMRKVRYYLANGVRLVWLIDPAKRTVRVYTEAKLLRTFTDKDTLDGGDVLPGFSVPVRDILPPEPAPATNGAQPSER